MNQFTGNGVMRWCRTMVFTLAWITGFGATLSAQQIIQGKILDAQDGTPMAGVAVVVKGTTNGVYSDEAGKFTLNNVATTDSLVFDFLGYSRLTMLAASIQANPEIALAPAAYNLESVVVTALGIKRSEKALGYSAQTVNRLELDAVRSTNPFTALKGKVAGLQVNTSSNGIASSSRIVIRGESSFNINANAPLLVVDGVIVNNDIYGVGGFNTDQANLPTDYGNAASEINPGDIESVNVLKGAAASALYGSRGGNGVIIISTRNGENENGIGVNFSTNTSFSSPLRLPEIQTTYGGGWGQQYFSDFGTNFGPAFGDAPAIPQDGHPGFADGEAVEFIQRYDMMDFFQTGVSTTNQVSLSAGNERGNLRVSYSNSYNE
ncbi:MAG: carboxypeptidase-like regulatory domain-containing protein, partial [Bacteroidota bacterium]